MYILKCLMMVSKKYRGLGQFRTRGNFGQVGQNQNRLISQNIHKFQQQAVVLILCSDIYFLVIIKFLPIMYPFSVKGIGNAGIPKLPHLHFLTCWNQQWKLFFLIFFFQNIIKGGKKYYFHIWAHEFPVSKQVPCKQFYKTTKVRSP